MKQIFKLNFLFVLLMVAFFAISCEDDIDADNEIENIEDILDSEYADVDVEDAKEDIEDAGIELVSEINALEDEEAIDIMIEMTNLFEEEDTPASSFNILLNSAQTLSKDSKSTVDMFSLLKGTTEEGIALSDSFTAQCATYTYDFETAEFVQSENADAILIEFPGKEGDLTNTAEIKIFGFEVQEITSPREDLDLPDGTIEFPAALEATLKYDETTVMSYELAASYMDDGTPTSISNTITIGSYSFSQDLTHSQYEEASFDYSFKNGDNTLIAFGAEVAGDWTSDNIDDNTTEESDTYTYSEWVYNEETQQWEEVEVTATDTWTETDAEEIINSSNAYIQFMDLKAAGKIDIKTIVDGEQAFEDANESYEDEYGDYPDDVKEAEADTLVSLVKTNAEFVLVYGDDNTMIAWLEPYKVTETETWEDWEGNTYTYNDYYLDFQMVFKDDSKISMETYVQDELNGFFDALNDFISQINSTYDMEFDDVDASDEESSVNE